VNFQAVIQWFELGGELKIPDLISTAARYQQLAKVQSLFDHIDRLGVTNREDEGHAAAAAELILEGLWAHRRIGRSEERGFYAEKQQRPPETRESSSRQRRGYN
jgi:magnesium chelatase subunit I